VNATSTASSVRLRARSTPANAAITSTRCQIRNPVDERVPPRAGPSHSRGTFPAIIAANRPGCSRG
jgi:hypothetical protein